MSKAEGMLPENFCFIVICFLQAIIELWKSHDRLHGIPGDNLARASRKGVENPCRENAIHRIPPMPASLTACWKCAFRSPVLGSASGRRTHRKNWNDWNFWSDESRDVSKIRRTVKVLLQENGVAYWIIAIVQKSALPLRNALRPHSMNGAHSQLF